MFRVSDSGFQVLGFMVRGNALLGSHTYLSHAFSRPACQEAAKPESAFFGDGGHMQSDEMWRVLPKFFELLKQDFGEALCIISDSSLCSAKSATERDC